MAIMAKRPSLLFTCDYSRAEEGTAVQPSRHKSYQTLSISPSLVIGSCYDDTSHEEAGHKQKSKPAARKYLLKGTHLEGSEYIRLEPRLIKTRSTIKGDCR